MLPATTDSPAIARGLIRSEMEDCDAEAVSAAQLMISELVTNALVHGASPIQIHLHHREESDSVEAAVTDGGKGLPEVRNARERDPHGRGLLVVRALAREWGEAEFEAGKTVWFTLPCHRYFRWSPGENPA